MDFDGSRQAMRYFPLCLRTYPSTSLRMTAAAQGDNAGLYFWQNIIKTNG